MKRIGDILTRNKTPVQVRDDETYKQVTIRTNYKGVVLRGSQEGASILTKSQFAVSAGQFILSRIDARNGAFGIVPGEVDGAIVTNDFLAFDINEGAVDRDYFAVLLQSPLFLEACVKASRGNTNRKRVDEEFFLKYPINLPRHSEQVRMMERINRARTKLANIQAEIGVQRAILANVRRAILQEAVQGRLTVSWRTSHATVVSAKRLLASINAERARLVASKQMRAGNPTPSIEIAEASFSIPDSWQWCRAGHLVQSYEAGSSFKCEERSVSGDEWGVIKTSAITSGSLVEAENKFYAGTAPTDTSAQVREGDLIFCRASGSKGLAGRCAIVRRCSSNLLLSDKTIRIRLMRGVSAEYFALHNESPHSKAYFGSLGMGKSTSMNNVTRGDLLGKPIPLPPEDEQLAIVARVEALLSMCGELEAEVERSSVRASELLEAVLNETFSSVGDGTSLRKQLTSSRRSSERVLAET